MASVDFQSATLATPPNTTKVEVVAVGATSRQVVTIGDLAGGAVDSIGGLTETAPATDTASSGLNGRLQRIAQRITSMTALLPAALGLGGGLKVDGSGTALPVSIAAAAAAIAKAEDVASVDADVGVPAMAVRKLTPANTSGSDGDYEMLQMSAGQLHVNSGHYQPGTNGFLASPFALIANSEAGTDTLGSGLAFTGATARSQTDTVGARKAEVYMIVGDAGATPTAGGVIAGWFLKSTDGGSTYENLRSTPSTTVPALPRPPDFLIPVYEGGTAQTAADIKFAAGTVLLPSGTFKTVIQNLSGAALGNTTTTHHAFMCAPIA